jgi:hypothetical protein
MLHWLKYQRKLSAYRDHSLEAEDYRAVWKHLYHCTDCRQEVSCLEQVGLQLRRLPSPAAPARLAGDIRIRISQERARRERPGWLWKLSNQWGHLALPGSVGVFAAVFIFGLLASQFTVPLRRGPDVPLDLRTSAYLPGNQLLEHGLENSDMVVQLLIDHRGRVAEYTILAGTYTSEDVRKLRNNLLFAVFEPAKIFGRPVTERLVLVNVRG